LPKFRCHVLEALLQPFEAAIISLRSRARP
jgi:hypothetical protein